MRINYDFERNLSPAQLANLAGYDGASAKLLSTLETKYQKPCVLANSYASALHLALCAISLKRGDKVLMSVNSHPFLPMVVRYFDAEPLLVDIAPDGYNIDISALEATLEAFNHKKLRALFLSHNCGNCADIAAISELCARYDVLVLNDAEIALELTSASGAHISEFAAISCFSLAPISPDAAYSAGFLLFNDPALAERAKLLSNASLQRHDWRQNGELGYFYNALEIGYDYSLRDLPAAAAAGFLQDFSARQAAYCALASKYDACVKNLRHLSAPEHGPHAHKYQICVDKNRDLFAKKLREDGILCTIDYIPLNFLSYYKQKYSLKITDFPNALHAYAQMLSLPFNEQIDADAVCAKLEQLDSEWV